MTFVALVPAGPRDRRGDRAPLDLPAGSISPEQAGEHFGFLGGFLGAQIPASSALTRERLGWQPTQPGLIEDLDQSHYFAVPAT